MAGLCVGGNEPPGSLKAIYKHSQIVTSACEIRATSMKKIVNDVLYQRSLAQCTLWLASLTRGYSDALLNYYPFQRVLTTTVLDESDIETSEVEDTIEEVGLSDSEVENEDKHTVADNTHVNTMRQMLNSNRHVIPSAFIFPKTLLKLQFEIFEKNCEVVNMNHGRPFQDGEKGVEMYSEVTAANSWIANKKGLSTSEWISSLKMTSNLAAVRSVPGRSLDAENGSTRRVDILAYNADTEQGIIVDPTIRFEVECHQSAEVHLEKKSIYEPTVNYFKLKYALIHVEVFGLLIGSRGAIPAFFEEFRRQFALPTSLRDDIVIIVLKESCQILINHMVPH
ncbi:hypothetical protein ANN_10919 [Periplaneta americana]|uniref:Uncharacterized protein n=1 Tax=Periplaneta americana TaxID=6978 RepID=A0ABQ8T3K9_PERAM|nr:hypothetical protein ANN_10919 [Periplaneta americana]